MDVSPASPLANANKAVWVRSCSRVLDRIAETWYLTVPYREYAGNLAVGSARP